VERGLAAEKREGLVGDALGEDVVLEVDVGERDGGAGHRRESMAR
jgi:hypothetical protein